MIEQFYLNNVFVSAVEDEKTVAIAYKFNDSTKIISIISLKSTDGLISKIKYCVTRFFGGYTSADLVLQRRLVQMKVTHLFDLEKMSETTQKVDRLKEEAEILSARGKSASKNLGSMLGDLDIKNKELETSREQLIQHQVQIRSLNEEAGALKEAIEFLKKEKLALAKDRQILETLVQQERTKLSEFNEENFKQVRAFYKGSDPISHLKLLLEQMKDRETAVNKYLENKQWCDAISQVDPDYIVKIRAIFNEILQGVKIPKQKTDLLVKLKRIDPVPSAPHTDERGIVMAALILLVEFNYRYHRINYC